MVKGIMLKARLILFSFASVPVQEECQELYIVMC